MGDRRFGVWPGRLAVTTNLSIKLLAKEALPSFRAQARLMSVGKRLVVGQADVRSAGLA
jgi:acyl-coenzyme A thioesterase PaaI-like protein